jgi:hypothetical protein
LIGLGGAKPSKYALNLVKHFYGDNLHNYVCTDSGEQPHNSNKIPMSLEYVELIKRKNNKLNILFIFY